MENIGKEILVSNGVFALLFCGVLYVFWRHIQDLMKEWRDREKEYLLMIKSYQEVITKLTEIVKEYGNKQNEIGGLQRKEHEMIESLIKDIKCAITKIMYKMRLMEEDR